ncbi:MAG: hypothetical protein ACXW30_03245 [Micavibrio sp.]
MTSLSTSMDLEQLKGRLIVYGDRQSPVEAWNDAIGLNPGVFYNTLTRDLPGKVIVVIESTHAGQGNLTIRVHQGAKTLIDIENKFSRHHKQMKFDEWRVGTEADRGKGLGSILLENHLNVMVPWGLRFIELRAGREDGPVYWSKKGLRIKDERYAEIFNHHVRENYNLHKERMGPETRRKVETILRTPTLDANIRLVGIPGELDGKKLSAILLSGSNPICIIDMDDQTQMENVKSALKSTIRARREVAAHFTALQPPSPRPSAFNF